MVKVLCFRVCFCVCVYLCASHACSFLFCLIVFKKRMKKSVKLESKGGGWYLGEDEGGQTVIRTEYMKKNKVSPAAA